MVIFNSYVKLPEGSPSHHPCYVPMFRWKSTTRTRGHLIHSGGTSALMVSRHGRILFLKARILRRGVKNGIFMGFLWDLMEV